MATVGRKNTLLTGSNLCQNQTQEQNLKAYKNIIFTFDPFCIYLMLLIVTINSVCAVFIQ